MTVIRVKGFKIFKDRHGKLRCYHRATGHKIDLAIAPIGSPGFFVECEKITASAKANDARAAKAGTLGRLIEAYYTEDHFVNLSPRTKADYRKVADFLRNIVDTPIYLIDTPLIAGIHDKAAKAIGWRQANILRTFLSEVFRFNVPRGTISRNFAAEVIAKPRPKTLTRANRPWTVDELMLVLELAPSHIAAAVAVMANTGLDPTDALRLPRSAVEGGVIWAQRGKTGQAVAIPMAERLETVLATVPHHEAETILANSRGQSWTYDGFATAWDRFKRKHAKDGTLSADLTLKGLRHTMATILRETGMDLREIADLLGQKTESMAQHYSRDAELANRNRVTMAAFQAEIDRRIKIVKPSTENVKPDNM